LFSAVLVLAGIALPLYDAHALMSMAWAFAASEAWGFFALAAFIFGRKHRRDRYAMCNCVGSQVSTTLKILSSLSWLSLRSVLGNVRLLISVVLMTRIGLAEGASYAVLRTKTFFCVGVCQMLGYGFLFVASRFWGSGQKQIALYFLDVLNLIVLPIGAFFALFWGSLGQRSLLSGIADDLDAQSIMNPWVFSVFLLSQVVRAKYALAISAIVTIGEQRNVALIHVAAFVVYLALALPGMSAFHFVYGAELAYYLVALFFIEWRLKIVGYRHCMYFSFPANLDLTSEWQEELQFKRNVVSRLCIFLSYLSRCLVTTFTDPDVIRIFGGQKCSAEPAPASNTKPSGSS